MKSTLVVHVIPEKNDDLTRNAKNRRKYLPIFIKISKHLYFCMDRCSIVFGENRNLLNIKNSGPKLAKFACFLQNYSILLRFEKMYFLISVNVCF